MVAQQCPSLRWINCTRCVELGDDGAIVLALKCHRLASLFLARCNHITDTSLMVSRPSSSYRRALTPRKRPRPDD